MTSRATGQRNVALILGLLWTGILLLAGCGSAPTSATSEPPPSASGSKGARVVRIERLTPSTHFTRLTSIPTPSIPVRWSANSSRDSAKVTVGVQFDSCTPLLGLHVVETSREVRIGVYARPQAGICAGTLDAQVWQFTLAEPLGTRHIVAEA